MRETYRRCDAGPLHLVQGLTDLFEICDVGAVWVERILAIDALREGIDKELHRATWVDFEVEVTRDGVLPELSCVGW
jgi:hypothetical protein